MVDLFDILELLTFDVVFVSDKLIFRQERFILDAVPSLVSTLDNVTVPFQLAPKGLNCPLVGDVSRPNEIRVADAKCVKDVPVRL